MRFHAGLGAVAALFAVIGATIGEDAKPPPQGQLKLLISPGETTQTITRPRDDQTAQKREIIISCESMTLDQGRYVFVNGTLETTAGYLSFSEIAVTFSGNSMSISSTTPNKGLKEIRFHAKPGVDLHAKPVIDVDLSKIAPPAPR
jgi:hypothetical protein